MMITVVNKQTHKPTPYDVYVGRPTCVGNPYSHKSGTLAKFSTATREEAVEKYRAWLRNQYQTNDVVYEFIQNLVKTHLEETDINLVCWCSPLTCHGNILKDAIEKIAAL
jgi:hypothetical protein